VKQEESTKWEHLGKSFRTVSVRRLVGITDAFLGLPPVVVEDLTAVPPPNGRVAAANGSHWQ
jgi:hypothetical protein